MSEKHQPFIERVLAGEVLDLSEIDDDVDSWHKEKPGVAIHEWLGMTEAEYALWVEQPAVLPFIAHSHKYGTSLRELVRSAAEPTSISARGASPNEVEELIEWLRKTGRI